MKKNIKEYLNKTFPELKADSIHGEYYIRFELGGNLRNGTKKRVTQVVKRAIEIYKQTIGEGKTLLLIEEYENEFYDQKNKNKNYLFSLIDETQFDRFHGPFEQTYYEEDNKGNLIEKVFKDKLECDLLIGETHLDNERVKKIIEGIANLEMGFEPSIPQDLYFFSMEKKLDSEFTMIEVVIYGQMTKNNYDQFIKN